MQNGRVDIASSHHVIALRQSERGFQTDTGRLTGDPPEGNRNSVEYHNGLEPAMRSGRSLNTGGRPGNSRNQNMQNIVMRR